MAETTDNRTRGILWMLATMVCFLTLDTIMKYGMESYSVLEVSWARFTFATVFAALLAGRSLPRIIKTGSPGVQLLRSVMLGVTTGIFNLGISQVPLPTATTIMMLTPILVTLGSSVFLGEHIGWRRGVSIAVGFVGAMIVARVWELGNGSMNIGVMCMIAAAFTNATYQGVTRILRGDSPHTTLLYSGAAGALATSLVMPWHWQWPSAFGWLLFMGSGLAACIGHLCLIRAYHAAPASVVAPFYYSSILWSVIYGFLIWGDLPAITTAVGALILMGSGLYIIWRERQLALPG